MTVFWTKMTVITEYVEWLPKWPIFFKITVNPYQKPLFILKEPKNALFIHDCVLRPSKQHFFKITNSANSENRSNISNSLDFTNRFGRTAEITRSLNDGKCEHFFQIIELGEQGRTHIVVRPLWEFSVRVRSCSII